MSELEESQIQGQLFLGNASMRTQPRTQERPKTFHRIDMDFVKAIAIVIPSVFPRRMIDRFVTEAPSFQTRVDVVFISENQASQLNGLFENRLDRFLLHIRQHAEDHLTTALDHAQDRRFLSLQGPTPALTFEPSAASGTTQFRHDFRMAFVSSDNVNFIAFDFTAQLGELFLRAIPSRNCVVMSCTVPLSNSSSAAIC